MTALAPPVTARPALVFAGMVKGDVSSSVNDIRHPPPAVQPDDDPPIVLSAFIVTLKKIRSVVSKNSVTPEHVAAALVNAVPWATPVIAFPEIGIWYKVGSPPTVPQT